jgi:hypothetical protein
MELLEAARSAIPDTTPWMMAAMVILITVLGLEAERQPSRSTISGRRRRPGRA